jgi:hypothetical protein
MVAASIRYYFSIVRNTYCLDKRKRIGAVYLYDILVQLNQKISFKQLSYFSFTFITLLYFCNLVDLTGKLLMSHQEMNEKYI